MNFMSSEESDDGDEEVIEVHPLPWPSDRVTTFLHSLDEKAHVEKSSQARRQMKRRCVGRASSRVRPTHDDSGEVLPSWLLRSVTVRNALDYTTCKSTLLGLSLIMNGCILPFVLSFISMILS